MKTILLLTNNIPFQLNFYLKLEKYLKKKYNIIYAIDSHYLDYISNKHQKITNAYYLSDYRTIEKSSHSSNWITFFPDIDRYLTLKLNNKKIDYQDIYKKTYNFFEKIYKNESISHVIYEPVSNSYSQIAYKVALDNQIDFLSISPSRFSERIEISNYGSIKDNENYRNQYSKFIPNKDKEIVDLTNQWLSKFDEDSPSYMKLNGLDTLNIFSKYGKIEKIKKLINGMIYSLKEKEDLKHSYLVLSPVKVHWKMFINSIRRIIIKYKIKSLYDEIKDLDKFIFYPLHFHPEASTSVFAPDYVDEITLIKSISFRLPLNCYLYVKDHPSAVGTMPYDFYKTLSKLPNVKFISSKENTKKLIRKSEGVICITSTVGFEAAVLNKPVYVMGNVFYEYFPNVKKLNSISEFKYSWFSNYKKINENEINNCIQFYMSKTAPGLFDYEFLSNNDEYTKKVAKFIENKIENIEE